MLSIDKVIVHIDENTTLTVKGNIKVSNSNPENNNINNRGVIIWDDGLIGTNESLTKTFLINTDVAPLFRSSSDPYLENTKDNLTYGSLVVKGVHKKTIIGSNNFFFNTIELNNSLTLNSDIKSFGDIEFVNGLFDLNGHNIALYDINSEINRISGKLINETNAFHTFDISGNGNVQSYKPIGEYNFGNTGFRLSNISEGAYSSASVFRFHKNFKNVTNGSINKYFNFNPIGGSGSFGNITARYFASDYDSHIGSQDSMSVFILTDAKSFEQLETSELTHDSITTTTANNIRSGTYTIANANCFHPPIIHFSKPDYAVCVGNNIDITCDKVSMVGVLQTDSIVTPVDYTWTDNNSKTNVVSLNNVTGSQDIVMTLNVTLANGCKSSKPVTISVKTPPVSKIKLTPLKSRYCEGDSIIVTDENTHIGGTYVWSPATIKYSGNEYRFALNSITENTDVTFNLLYTDNNGCTSTNSANAHYITNPHTGIAFADSSICLNQELEIKNLSGTDGGITNYIWKIGNGDSITVDKDNVKLYGPVPVELSNASKIILGMNPPGLNIKYLTPNTYKITLKAKTIEGCIDSTSLAAIVYPTVQAGINLVSNDTVCLQTPVKFCAVDTTGLTFISKYHWMIFNDVNSNNPVKEYTMNNYNDTLNFVFTSSGKKKIVLEVSSLFGCTSTMFQYINVLPRPNAAFSALPVCQKVQTLIRNSSTSAYGENYYWSLDNLTLIKSDTLAFNHQFTSDGTYNVALKVINSYGCSDTISHNVIVWPLPKPVIETRNSCINTQIKDTIFVNHTTGTNTYSWLFGDGSGSQLFQPAKEYTKANTYNISLTVTNQYGCSAIINDNVTIHGIIIPSIQAVDACLNYPIVFSAPVGADQYAWYYGDGDSTKAVTGMASHKYKNPGLYTVLLKLTTIDKCTTGISKNITAFPVPVASFKVDPSCIGTNSVFELSDSTLVNQNCSYYWDFGDNSSSNIINAQHTYLANGSYPVKLTVTSDMNCTSNRTVNAIVDTLPKAQFDDLVGTCLDHITLSAKNSNCTYLWSDNSTADTLYIIKNGNYSVSITNNFTGCNIQQSTEVKLHSQIFPNLSDFSGCGPTNVKTSVYGATYLWNTGEKTQSITLSDTGKHVVYVNVWKDNCSGSDTATIYVHPVPVIDLGVDKSLCFGDNLKIDAATSNNLTSTYSWASSDPAFGSQPLESINIINNTSQLITYQYQATITSTNNCSASDNISVTLRTKIPINLGPDGSLCEGESLVIDASIPEASKYVWNDGYVSSSRTIMSNLQGNRNQLQKIIWAQATDQYGCSVTDSIALNLNPNPLVTLSDSYNQCNGDTIAIDATQPDIKSYLWDPQGNQSPILKLFNSSTGSSETRPIRLELTNIYGCTVSSKWININFKSAPQHELPLQFVACNMGLINAGNAGSTFSWDNGKTGQYQVIRNSGTYKVHTTNANNCSIDDSVQVTINPVLQPSLGGYKTICSNTPMELFTGINNESYSFLWSNNSTENTLKVSTSGKYWVQATNTFGCVATDTVIVDSKPSPIVDLGPDATLCSKEYFPITTSAKGSLYYWGSTNSEYNQVSSKGYLEVKDTGTYWVKVVTSDDCESSDSINVLPTSNPLEASFLAVSKFNSGDSIQFLDMSHPNPISWFWDLGDMRVSHDQDPLHVYYACDTFHVVLNASNGVCQSTLTKDVVVSGCTKSGKFINKAIDNRYVTFVSSMVYPNPTRGDLNLDISLSAPSEVFIYIFNMMGVLQKIDRIGKTDVVHNFYNISEMPMGVYLIKIVAGGSQKTYKIIKQ